MTSFCANCGTARGAGAFCGNCGTAYEPPSGTMNQNLAQATITVQNFGLRLLAGRIIGLVVALALWYVAIVPMTDDSPLVVMVAFPIAAVLGIFLGERVTLEMLRR